jgi:hypothetical protein
MIVISLHFSCLRPRQVVEWNQHIKEQTRVVVQWFPKLDTPKMLRHRREQLSGREAEMA